MTEIWNVSIVVIDTQNNNNNNNNNNDENKNNDQIYIKAGFIIAPCYWRESKSRYRIAKTKYSETPVFFYSKWWRQITAKHFDNKLQEDLFANGIWSQLNFKN